MSSRRGQPVARVRCRMYREEYPEVDSVVVAIIKSIDQTACYVTLPEYNDKEGMILLSDFVRRRVRNISRMVKIGKQVICEVIRVDPERGYIDLSKKNVKPAYEEETITRYTKAKKVHSIVCHAANVCGKTPLYIYERGVWDLYDAHGHALDAFEEFLQADDPAAMFHELFPEDPKIAQILLKNVSKFMAPKPVKLRAEFRLTCFGYRGVEAIRDALRAGLARSSPDLPVEIELVSSPTYRASATAVDRDAGKRAVRAVLKAVSERIGEERGGFKLVSDVHVDAHAE